MVELTYYSLSRKTLILVKLHKCLAFQQMENHLENFHNNKTGLYQEIVMGEKLFLKLFLNNIN